MPELGYESAPEAPESKKEHDHDQEPSYSAKQATDAPADGYEDGTNGLEDSSDQIDPNHATPVDSGGRVDEPPLVEEQGGATGEMPGPAPVSRTLEGEPEIAGDSTDAVPLADLVPGAEGVQVRGGDVGGGTGEVPARADVVPLADLVPGAEDVQVRGGDVGGGTGEVPARADVVPPADLVPDAEGVPVSGADDLGGPSDHGPQAEHPAAIEDLGPPQLVDTQVKAAGVEAPVAEVPVAEVLVAQVPVAEVPVAEVPVADVPVAEVPLPADRSGAPESRQGAEPLTKPDRTTSNRESGEAQPATKPVESPADSGRPASEALDPAAPAPEPKGDEPGGGRQAHDAGSGPERVDHTPAPDRRVSEVAGTGPADAPRASDIVDRPEVVEALDAAWSDSQPDDPMARHEEGGWIVGQRDSNDVRVVRVPAGERAQIRPGDPPALGEGERVVAFFHTHPNPDVDEIGRTWTPGPSIADQRWHDYHGLPGIVRNAGGTEVFGPGRAR